MTNNNTKHIQVIFRCVFGLPFLRTEVHLHGLPRVFYLLTFAFFFVEIKSDKVILDLKKSYLVYFENFHFLWFFHLWPDISLKKSIHWVWVTGVDPNPNPKSKSIQKSSTCESAALLGGIPPSNDVLYCKVLSKEIFLRIFKKVRNF